MEDDGTRIHTETDDVRAGSTPHVVRWILAISLFAAIVLLSAIWIGGALRQDDTEKEASFSARIAEGQRESDAEAAGEQGSRGLEAPGAAETAPSGGSTVEN